MAAEEGWGTSSGLPEEMTGTVAEAWFGKNENAEGDFADKVYLWWKLINIDSPEYDGDEYTVRLGIGNGWEAVDSGKRAVREDGKEKPFNASTDYGKVINRVMGANGGKEGREYAEAFAGAFDAVKEKGKPDGAEVWVGLRFHFENQEFSSTINGEAVEWTRLLPVKFEGEDGRVGGGSATATAPAAAPETNGGGVEDQLKELAKNSSSHGEFVAAALGVSGVSTNDELLAHVADDSDNGLYAKANA